MFSRMMIGMGKIVIMKSETQLMMPAMTVTVPSSRHFAVDILSTSQYASTGLECCELCVP